MLRNYFIQRKAFHFGSVLFVLVVARVLGLWGALLACAALLTAFMLARYTGHFRGVRQHAARSYGDVYLSLGLALAAVLTLPSDLPTFCFAALVLGLADPIASIVGTYGPWGKFHILGEQHSMSGSAAFFVTALLIGLTLSLGASTALVTALVLTVVEVVSLRGSDNLTLPVMSVLMLSMFAS